MSKFGDEFLRRALETQGDWGQFVTLCEEAFSRSSKADKKHALHQAAKEAAEFFPWKGRPTKETGWSGWPREGVTVEQEAYGMPVQVYQLLTVFAGAILAGLAPNGIDSVLAEVMRPIAAEFVDHGLSEEQEKRLH